MFEKFKSQIIAHAEEMVPEECLGVIVGDEYIRVFNAADDPEKFFAMSEEDEFLYGFHPQSKYPKPSAVVHSHPNGPSCPSEADMRAWIAHGVPFVMVAWEEGTGWDYWEMGDHVLDYPLEEREFRSGVTDCKEAIRAWYWQEKGIYLPPCARREEFWKPVHEDPDDDTSPIVRQPDALYADNFKDWGFVQLTAQQAEEDLQPGDVFFHKMHAANAAVPANTIETHGGVYLGDGMIYHHLPNRLSCKEAADGWARKAARWVRYAPCKED
jgi:proteasome lid subunit RPN8/RPN11